SNHTSPSAAPAHAPLAPAAASAPLPPGPPGVMRVAELRRTRSVPPSSAPLPFVDPEVLTAQLKDKDDRISLLETQMAAQQAGYEAQRRLNQQTMEMMQRMYPNEEINYIFHYIDRCVFEQKRIDRSVFLKKYSEGHFPRNFPRDNSLGKFRGTDPSEYTEGTVPRNKPRKKSVGILLSIDVYMSKHASIDELPRNYPDEVLPRYIPRTFSTNKGSSEFPRKFISSEFRRKILRDFRGKKKFRGIISDDVFRRNFVGITIFRRNSDDFFPQNP
uniref:Uncharacterized protein n=1 Tax=Brassica oleracea var. oleracea TaxID=109376 RepID=A0A0D3AL81_BRAOL